MAHWGAVAQKQTKQQTDKKWSLQLNVELKKK
jgi:hypothetical protein